MSEPEQPKKSGWMDKLKDATSNVVEKTREGVETSSRSVNSPRPTGSSAARPPSSSSRERSPIRDLTPMVDKIRELKAALEAEWAAEAPAEPPAAG